MTEFDDVIEGSAETFQFLEPSERCQKAQETFHRAYRLQLKGNLEEAAELYQRSISLHPTAEAHTFLGWTYSQMERLDCAIEECQRAIAIDPGYGNPYNDIGAYLIQKGHHCEAIPWLKKAMNAPRYECCFYPHFNLGRIYEARDELLKAIREYTLAYQANRQYTEALTAVRRLQSRLN